MNVIKRLKRAIGLSELFEKEVGPLDQYKTHLVRNARTKLKRRRREVVQKESRRINFRQARGSKWRGR